MSVRCRKSIYDLTPVELTNFRNAVQAMKASGAWDWFVQSHAQAMNRATPLPPELPNTATRNAAHRGPSFLPWHRHFIKRFEEALQAEDPSVMLPYWPWERDGELADPTTAQILTTAYMGAGTPFAPPDEAFSLIDDGPTAGWSLYRVLLFDNPPNFPPDLDADDNFQFHLSSDPMPAGRIAAFGGFDGLIRSVGPKDVVDQFNVVIGTTELPTTAEVDECLTYEQYDRAPWDRSVDGNNATGGFRNRLEGWVAANPGAGLHNAVHVWIGGDMGPGTSPNDPLFFLHHCNVDRLWAKWQERQREDGSSYDSNYLPQTGGPAGHNIDNPMFPWNGDPLYPTEPIRTPRGALDYSVTHGFIYDDVPIVELDNSTINFNSVPEGEIASRAAVFNIKACRDVQFQVIAGPTVDATSDPGTAFTELPSDPFVPNPAINEGKAWVWFSYTGTSDLDEGSGSVTIRGRLEVGGEVRWQRDWVIPIAANTVSRPSAALVLALDRSNSMSFNSGLAAPYEQRIDILHYAAPPLLDLIHEGNAVGIVSFDHDAHDVMDVTPVGPLETGAGRLLAKEKVGDHAHNPAGNTAIGDGVELAHNYLEPETSYGTRATVVFTDGHETAEKYITDVLPDINERVYAIGLGTAEQLQPAAMIALTNMTGGYVMLSGEIDDNTPILLSKYYLQILAGVVNDEIVTDPMGWLSPGQEHRIPFSINEADIGCDVILLSAFPDLVNFRLETPGGDVIDAGTVGGTPGGAFVNGTNVSFYRMNLPLPIGAGGAKEGTWHALLSVDEDAFKKGTSRWADFTRSHRVIMAHGIHYSLNVHARSNLNMQTTLTQNGFEPGAQLTVRTVLTQYGRPVAAGSSLRAEFVLPDKSTSVLPLAELEPGVFEATSDATLPGVYQCRVLASGSTLGGLPFTREQLRTGAVWHGGDEPPPSSSGGPSDSLRWLQLLSPWLPLLILIALIIIIILLM